MNIKCNYRADGIMKLPNKRELFNFLVNRYEKEMMEEYDIHINGSKRTTWFFDKEFTWAQQCFQLNPEGYREAFRVWLADEVELAWNTLEEEDTYCIGDVEMFKDGMIL